MTPPTDYRRHAILYVDDEEKSLRSFARAFGEQFRVLTAQSAQDGLQLLEQHGTEIGVLMTDQRMPGHKGVWLLEQARSRHPHILRILVTAYADMDAAIQSVNSGAIYKYVTKPWDPPVLETLLKRALDFFHLGQERDQLIKEKMSILHNLMVADRLLSLGLLAAGLSHHIRNALVSVKTFLDLTPSKLEAEGLNLSALRQPDFWKEYHQSVQAQVDRINNLLKDLWLAAEKPAFEFKDVVRLRDVIDLVIEKFQTALAARGLRAENHVSPALAHLTVDHKRFSRLFELLLEDELVSLPSGCCITFHARAQCDDTREPHVRIEVSDNGPGLPKDALRLLFDPFMVRTDSPSEYGLRLMACFFIAHQHGGKIIAQSTEGKGTTFLLKIPLNPAHLPIVEENQLFLERVFLNEELWEKHLTGTAPNEAHPPTPSTTRQQDRL